MIDVRHAQVPWASYDQLMVLPRVVRRSTERPYESNRQTGNSQEEC